MKLDNIKTYVTNPQFSGGRNIGIWSATNTSFATASVSFTGIAANTASFSLTDYFGETTTFFLTASNQATASFSNNVTPGVYYIAIGANVNATVANIAQFLNASASLVVSASSATSNLIVSSSNAGTMGNSVFITSGSSNFNLGGATGTSNYPWSFPGVAGGLYVGGIGTLTGTTVDGSVITLVSASGFIPGLFSAVDSNSSARSIVALK